MFTLTRILLCLAVSLSLAGACAGQNSKKSKSSSQKGKPRPAQEPEEMEVIAPLTSKPAESRRVGRAEVSYHHVPRDTVDAVVVLPEVYRGRGQTMGFVVDFVVGGKEISKPEEVHVSFDTDETQFKADRADRLVLEADGRQFSFSIPRDWQAVDIDFPSFEQIARSKSVKGRLGRLTFELTGSHLEALRDLLRAIESPARKP
jgi:hypothetical protein